MWLDDTRIPFVETEDIDFNSLEKNNKTGSVYGNGKGFHIKHERLQYTNKGRFTPNLLVCDDMLNDGNISNSTGGIPKTSRRYGENNFTNGGLFTPEGNITDTYNDKGSSSRYYDLDLWFDKMLERL
jgi:hypothetical protein